MQSMRANNPLPDKIQNAPSLILGLEIYLKAFFELDCERSHSMGATPIPWSSIYNYARCFNFDKEQTEDLIFFVRALDNEHLKHIRKKQNGKSGKPSR